MSIGFGFERLGLLTLRYPRAVALAIIVFTGLCIAEFPNVRVDGNLMRVFAHSGEQYDRYEALTKTFGTFENDAYILIKTDRLTDPAVLEKLRGLAFDLELNDYAAGTLSPFVLRKPGPNGSSVPAVPENMRTPEQVRAALLDLRANDPMMRNLIVGDLTGLVMILFPDPELTRGDGEKRMIASLRELVAQHDSADVHVELTGPPIWTTEMLDASINDQIKFSGFGFVIGAITALLALRSLWGALLATLTPFVSVIWVVGAITMLFGSFTFLTNIVTTLVLVIAFAESMYFCFTWLRLWSDGMDPNEAINETVRRVSPAAALTSLTTMVSFASLSFTKGQGIEEFGYSGVIAVALAFVTLVTFLPLALKLAVRLGFKRPQRFSVAVTAPIPVARLVAARYWRPVSIAAVIVTALLFYPHFAMQPRFSFEDFLPSDSQALQTAKGIDSGVGGVAPIYIRVPLSGKLDSVTDADFARIRQVHEIVENVIGKGKVISAASFAHYADEGFSRQDIFNAVGPYLKRRFVTDDGTQALVTGFLPTVMPSDQLEATVQRIDADLEAAGIDSRVAGFRLLTTFASTDMIGSMRNSLMAAIIVNIGLIGFAFRSLRIGLVAIIPNVLPILGTEFYLWWSGAGLQLTTVIALTIAFGIAVDDTIHYLATYVRARRNGIGHEEAIDFALERIGPALVATTLILCAGTIVVVFSDLPQVALFGTLTVLTLVTALVGDLLVLPALLMSARRFFVSLGGVGK
ncbi:MAG TPA: MMPL family transporter [Devosiaceae bacterium]